MPRQLEDWLSAYVAYTENQESPVAFHLWTGLTVLSAAIRRRFYLDRGFYKLYPNLYVVLVGESARVKKSVAMDIGVDLLELAVPGVVILKDRMTPEGVCKHLNRIAADVDKLTKDSHIFLYGDELASIFGYERATASRMAILLTRMYAAKTDYHHTTGEYELKIYNTYPVMLAGTDPSNLKVLPPEAVGGLLGRLIFVFASKPRRRIAWGKPDASGIALMELLKQDLSHISELSGVFDKTAEAEKLFEEWYMSQDREIQIDPRMDAFRERCHDTALKIAMLLSVSKRDSLVLEKSDVAGGIAFIEQLMPETSRALAWTGGSIYEQNRAKMIALLIRSGSRPMGRSEMLKAMGLPASELDVLEETLAQEGTIERRVIESKKYYKLVQKKEEST